MTNETRKQQHDKLFNIFIYEMFCEPVKERNPDKSPRGLSKKAKFLQRMKEQAKSDPGEI